MTQRYQSGWRSRSCRGISRSSRDGTSARVRKTYFTTYSYPMQTSLQAPPPTTGGRTGCDTAFTRGCSPRSAACPLSTATPSRRVRKLLNEMLERGVVEPSASPWASPIVLVRKKDESTRFCVDYRKLNDVTRKDAYPLPRIDATLDTLHGSQWFSTLDLLSGYWQVEVDEADRQKTAFCTTKGLFQFKVMPFGLCNAHATFQRLMDLVLAGLQWSDCLVYIDDVIVLGLPLTSTCATSDPSCSDCVSLASALSHLNAPFSRVKYSTWVTSSLVPRPSPARAT